jgi:hypothetical protein
MNTTTTVESVEPITTTPLPALDECEAPSGWDAGTILFDPYI